MVHLSEQPFAGPTPLRRRVAHRPLAPEALAGLLQRVLEALRLDMRLLGGGHVPHGHARSVLAGVARQGLLLRPEFGHLGVVAAELGFQLRVALGELLDLFEQGPVRAAGLVVLAPERVPAVLGGREQGAAALAADRLPDLRLQRGRDRFPSPAHAEGAVDAPCSTQSRPKTPWWLRPRPPLAGRREAEQLGQGLDRVARNGSPGP